MQRGPLIMEKILVIEDDESIRLELAALLRANGYLPVDKPPCDLALLDIICREKMAMSCAGSCASIQMRPLFF